MKKILLAALFFIFSLFCFSQNESKQTKTIWLRPFAESGITFLNNDLLKEQYLTTSAFYWSGGLRFGDATQNAVLPYVQFGQSKFTRHLLNATGNQLSDSVLRIRELGFGLQIVLKRFDKRLLRSRLGVYHSQIEDELFRQSTTGKGLVMGLGYEVPVSKRSRFYFEFTVHFNKSNRQNFRDYDNKKLAAGFIL
jgi:hypothetical protein